MSSRRKVPAHAFCLTLAVSVQGACLPGAVGRYGGGSLTLDLACSRGPNPCDVLQCQLPLGMLGEGKSWPYPLVLGGMSLQVLGLLGPRGWPLQVITNKGG